MTQLPNNNTNTFLTISDSLYNEPRNREENKSFYIFSNQSINRFVTVTINRLKLLQDHGPENVSDTIKLILWQF